MMKCHFVNPPIRCVFGSFPAISVLLVVFSFGCELFFPEVRIQIINHADVAIVGVRTKLPEETTWGENLLEDDVPSETGVALYLPRETYDFRIDLVGAESSYVYAADLTSLEIYVFEITGADT